jgi:LacI family transcriptional regulator
MKRNILVILSTTHHGFLRGIARYAREHGWHINTVMAFTGKVPDKWSGDGIISHCGGSDELADRVNSLHLPTVELSSLNQRVKAARIDTDYAAFGVAAAEYFLQRRFRSFAVAPLADDALNHQRMHGFTARLAREGHLPVQLPPLVGDAKAAYIDWPKRLAIASELLRDVPKPLAVFAYNDCVGVDIISLCEELGFLVPEQVAVLGVDNDELICEACRVPLSSVRFDLAELAYQGAALLDEIMRGHCTATHRLVPAGSGIVTRLSTNIMAISNVRVAMASQYIISHLFDPQLTAAAVATHAKISERGLRKAFFKHMGRSINEEIAMLRDAKMRELLRTTKLSTKEIAAATGLSSGNYLARFFRRRHGINPSAYRRSFHQSLPHEPSAT